MIRIQPLLYIDKEAFYAYGSDIPLKVYGTNRLLHSLNLLKILEDLELYLTFTDRDLGLIGCDYHRPFDSYHHSHKAPVQSRSNQDFSKILLPGRHDIIAGKQCFSIDYADRIVETEVSVLTNSHHPFDTISYRRNKKRKTCISIMKKVKEVFYQRFNDIYEMGFFLNYKYERWPVSTIIGPDNRPCWDSEDEKLELLFSSDGTIGSGILTANISTVVLKVWRMYFTLLEHMNHPSCQLTDASTNFEKEEKGLPLRSHYIPVAKDWARLGINI